MTDAPLLDSNSYFVWSIQFCSALWNSLHGAWRSTVQNVPSRTDRAKIVDLKIIVIEPNSVEPINTLHKPHLRRADFLECTHSAHLNAITRWRDLCSIPSTHNSAGKLYTIVFKHQLRRNSNEPGIWIRIGTKTWIIRASQPFWAFCELTTWRSSFQFFLLKED